MPTAICASSVFHELSVSPDQTQPPHCAIPGIAIPLKTPRADIGRRLKMALVIELVALDALVQVEPVAFVGPERVDARLHQRHVLLPVVRDVRLVQRFAWPRRNRPVQRRELVAIPRHHVDDDFHVARVQVGDDGRAASRLKTSGLNWNDGCFVFHPRGVNPVPR